jgi:hypothetical protein
MSSPGQWERRRGVVAYSVNVRECVTTKKLTNLMFRREGDGQIVPAYDQASADASFKDPSKTEG